MSSSPENDEILWGAQAIADEIKRELRPTYYLLENRLLDADKVGAVWVSTRGRLRRQFGTSKPTTGTAA